VSIKNKLVTAVTTAGLLAGLFGSAFVPSVRAGDDDAALTMAYAAADASDTTYAYYLTTAFPVFTLAIDPDGATDDNGVYGISIDAGTIRSCTASVTTGGGAADTVSTPVVTGTQCTATFTFDNAGDAGGFTVTLNKLTAAQVITVTFSDENTDSVTATAQRKLIGQASTAAATVVDATLSQATLKMNSDRILDAASAGDDNDGAVDSAGGGTKDVADEVIGGVNYFMPVETLKGAVWTGLIKNGYDGTMATRTALAEISNSNFAIGCDATVDGTAATSSATVQSFTATNGIWECETFASATSAGGTYTVTIKDVLTGKTLATWSAAFYGVVTELTASLVDGDRLPEVGGADADDFIDLVGKDANGKTYGDAELTALTIIGRGTVAGGTAAGDLTMVDGTTVATKGYYKADDALCPALSTGKTATIAARHTNASTTVVTSNSLTITCAAAAADALTVQKIEFEKSNPVPGEEFSVYVYLEDEDGVLAGAGDVAGANFALSLTGATDSTALWDGTTVTAAGNFVTGNGRIEMTIKAPATVGTVITVSDPTTSAIAKVYTTNDAYAGVLSVGPKKLKATADFGPAASNKKVAFVLESAAGVTKTYYRKANASGVASYTIALRGTWTVYATFGDEISGTGTMRR
jgi:hypothetical protein